MGGLGDGREPGSFPRATYNNTLPGHVGSCFCCQKDFLGVRLPVPLPASRSANETRSSGLACLQEPVLDLASRAALWGRIGWTALPSAARIATQQAAHARKQASEILRPGRGG